MSAAAIPGPAVAEAEAALSVALGAVSSITPVMQEHIFPSPFITQCSLHEHRRNDPRRIFHHWQGKWQMCPAQAPQRQVDQLNIPMPGQSLKVPMHSSICIRWSSSQAAPSTDLASRCLPSSPCLARFLAACASTSYVSAGLQTQPLKQSRREERSKPSLARCGPLPIQGVSVGRQADCSAQEGPEAAAITRLSERPCRRLQQSTGHDLRLGPHPPFALSFK